VAHSAEIFSWEAKGEELLTHIKNGDHTPAPASGLQAAVRAAARGLRRRWRWRAARGLHRRWRWWVAGGGAGSGGGAQAAAGSGGAWAAQAVAGCKRAAVVARGLQAAAGYCESG
jgi:hypothetical protein